MIFRAPQAPLKISNSSPANPDLPLDSRPEAEVHAPAVEPLIISSLEDLPTAKLLIVKGTLNHAPIKILIDSGATGNFISQQAVDHFSFSIDSVPSISIVFANGAKGVCNKAATAAYLCFQDHEERINLRVVSLPKHDVILGKTWLEKWNPIINWRTHQITFPGSDNSTLPTNRIQTTAIKMAPTMPHIQIST